MSAQSPTDAAGATGATRATTGATGAKGEDAELRALLGPRARDAGADGFSGGALDALLNDTLAATRAPMQRLAELRTPARIAAAGGATLAIAALALLLVPGRPDLALGNAAVLAALLGVLGLAALAVSLRGLHQRPLTAWQALVPIALALGVPALLAFWPDLWSMAPAASSSPASALAPDTCYPIGLVLASFVTAVLWRFQRATTATWQRLLAALGAGGVAAFVVLQLHCGSLEALHVLVGHAGVGVTLAALALLFLEHRTESRKRACRP